MKFVAKPYDSNDHTFGMLLHYFFENWLAFDESGNFLEIQCILFRAVSLLFSVLNLTYEIN